MNDSNNANKMLEVIGQVLIRCFVMGIVVLLFWWGALLLTGDLAYKVHSKLVLSVSREQFNIIHYSGMLWTKMVVFVLFLLPHIGIRLVIGKREE